MTRSAHISLACVLVVAAMESAWGQETKPSSAVTPVRISAEPLKFKSGEALARRVIVASPAEISGVLSWTIESRRHRGTITVMAVSPDGQKVATGGYDATIRIWNLATGHLERVLIGHLTPINSLVWSPCGSVLASCGSWEVTARIWDANTGQPLRIIKSLKSYITRASWAPDGSHLALSGYPSGWVSLWNPSNNEHKILTEAGQAVYDLAWSPDSKVIAISSTGKAVMLCLVSSGKSTRTLGIYAEGEYTTLGWSPDGRMFAAGSSLQGTIWDVPNDPGTEAPARKLDGRCDSLAWSPDGKQLVTTPGASFVQFWDAASGKAGLKLTATAARVAWNRVTGQILTSTTDQISSWKPGEAKSTASIDAAASEGLLWSPSRPIVTGLRTAKLSMWEPVSARFQRTLEGHVGTVMAAAWTRDGKTLASGGADKDIRLWGGRSGELLHTLKGHTSTIMSLAWSPDNRFLASAGYDKLVKVWDTSGRCVQTYDGHTGVVRTVAWTPGAGGMKLISGGDDGNLFLWNTTSTRPVQQILVHSPVYSVAPGVVGKTLYVACGGVTDALPVYNGGTGELVTTLRIGAYSGIVSGLAWPPSGNQVLCGRSTFVAHIWDVTTAKTVRNFYTTGIVNSVDWLANGALVMTSNLDRTTQFWDVSSGDLRMSLLADKASLVMISADGHWRGDSEHAPDLVYVAQTPEGQLTLSPEDFATRYRWRNNPARVKPISR